MIEGIIDTRINQQTVFATETFKSSQAYLPDPQINYPPPPVHTEWLLGSDVFKWL